MMQNKYVLQSGEGQSDGSGRQHVTRVQEACSYVEVVQCPIKGKYANVAEICLRCMYEMKRKCARVF